MNAAEQLLGEAALARNGECLALLCGDEALSYRELAGRMHASVAELPRAASGKVQRFKLREILERELARKP